jgi:hypothetical protein
MLGAATSTLPISRAMLWVDRVGSFLFFLKPRLRIGGPGEDGSAVDLSLLANLSRHHATIEREGETYLLTPHGRTAVGGRPVSSPELLSDGNEIVLGSNVRMRFRIPSPMTNTARIDFVSEHRPRQSVNAVILMDETCLLGPGVEHHVPCPVWKEPVVLYQRDEKLWCKSRSGVSVNGSSHSSSMEVTNGAVVAGGEFRFRVEWA